MERWYTLDSSHFSSLPALLSFSYFLLSAKSWVVYSHKVNWTCLLDQTEMVDGNTVYLIRNMIGSLRFQGSLQEESFVHSVALSCLTLCDPMNCSPPSSFVHGILQAKILEGVAIPITRGSSRSRNWTWVSCIAGRYLTTRATHLWFIPLLKIAQIFPKWDWSGFD